MSVPSAAVVSAAPPVRRGAEPIVLTFSLPWPPSVNHYWFTKRTGPQAGIPFISTEGKQYRIAVSEAVMAQRIPRRVLTGRLSIDVIACVPDRRERDLDNLWKALLDSLKHAGVVVSDGHFDHECVDRGAVVPGGKLRSRLAEIRGEPMQSFALFDEASA